MGALFHTLVETPWWRTPSIAVAVCSSVVAALAIAGAHLGLSRSTSERAKLLLVAPALLMCAGAIAAPVSLIARVRGHTLEAALRPAWTRADLVMEELEWLTMGALSLLVLGAAAGLALGRVASRGPRWLAHGATLAVVATALSALAFIQGFEHALTSPPLGWIGSHPDVNAAIRARLLELEGVLASGKALLVAIGAVTIVALLALRTRTTERWFRGSLSVVGAGLVFGLGVAAFAATRDHAADRARPVRLTKPLSWIDDPSEPIAALRGPCAPESVGPAVMVIDGEIAFDHRQTDPSRFAEELEVLRRNWAVLHGRREPGLIELHLIAAPNARLDPLRPYFARARAGGIRTLALQALRTEALSTHTLGVLDAPRRCVLRVDLIDGAAPLPETFEALALEIARGRTTLEVSPR